MSDKPDYNKRGEQDAAAGYDSRPPNGVERLVVQFFSPSAAKKMEEENEEYLAGYRNTQNQKDK